VIKPRDTFLPIATTVFGKEEKDEILAAMDSGWITIGPRTKKFEEDLQNYLGVKHAIALTSGSTALHLAVAALGVKEGDEVIVPTFTFAATAHAVTHCGGKPVFVDVDKKTFNIDPKLIEQAITKKTKGIIPVHYSGQPVDLDAIHKIAKKYNLFVVEDAAHAIGTKYKGKMIGGLSDATCFSFHPVKNMTTGDGGAIATNNEELANKIRVLRVNGMNKESWNRTSATGSWDYAIRAVGFKFHMSDLNASLGIHQLKKLDKNNAIRASIADVYDAAFADVPEVTIPYRVPNAVHAHNLYGILIDTSSLTLTRNEIMEELKKYNVGSIVYYRPLHLQPYFQETFKVKEGQFPIAEYIFERLICLPMYHGMKKADALFVVKVLKHIIDTHRK
jgi:dTDP-4-amino-4,6-dideoxygalactose transaminase